MRFQSKHKMFYWWKCIWKYRLGNGSHFVQGEIPHSDLTHWGRVMHIWVRSWNWGCLVTWFCYQLIAKQCMKRPVAHSLNSTWFWIELPENCCEPLKFIMKYISIQFCERPGHGRPFHALAKPGNKTAAVSWPDPYASVNYPSLVQIMACRLVGAKPLSEPTL